MELKISSDEEKALEKYWESAKRCCEGCLHHAKMKTKRKQQYKGSKEFWQAQAKAGQRAAEVWKSRVYGNWIFGDWKS
jgi:hypothetical protein